MVHFRQHVIWKLGRSQSSRSDICIRLMFRVLIVQILDSASFRELPWAESRQHGMWTGAGSSIMLKLGSWRWNWAICLRLPDVPKIRTSHARWIRVDRTNFYHETPGHPSNALASLALSIPQKLLMRLVWLSRFAWNCGA